MPERDVYVLPRYDEVRVAVQGWKTFGPAQGVGPNDRVERFDVIERTWRRNNALHGLEQLVVRISPAG